MGRPIDAESLLDHARRKPLKYSDEQTRQRGVYDDDNEQRFCGACGADLRR